MGFFPPHKNRGVSGAASFLSCSCWSHADAEGCSNRKYCAVWACIAFLSRPKPAANKQTFLLVKRGGEKEKKKRKKPGRLHKVHQQMWPVNASGEKELSASAMAQHCKDGAAKGWEPPWEMGSSEVLEGRMEARGFALKVHSSSQSKYSR